MHKQRCVACGGQLEPGVIEAENTGIISDLFKVVKDFRFVRPSEPKPTSLNPIKAILQGWREGGSRQRLPLEAFRCVGCGRVELYAGEGETSGT